MKNAVIFLKGIIIGIANIIPGVSGGTLALILGIYEKLIESLHNISFKTFLSFIALLSFKKGSIENFKIEMNKINASFLMFLFSGAVAAIFILAKFMNMILDKHHEPTYGFFFGLILASVIVPYKLIRKRTLAVYAAMIIAAFCVASSSIFISNDKTIEKEQTKYELKLAESENITSAKTEYSLLKAGILFIAGAVAVSAMILPGISGSFMLLLMGQYFIILKAVSEFNIFYLSATGLGIIAGLLAFTKILNYLLSKFYDITMGFLTGLVAGSLYVIWPFKAYVAVGTSAVKGYPQAVYLNNIFPAVIDSSVAATVLLASAGVITVAIMIIAEKKFKKF
ncbi:MAG: DUF368 domain-containing protein [Spirochaetes bacterium]|nr:DUF368 domain-containing protein [Spirochaetota bacterium]